MAAAAARRRGLLGVALARPNIVARGCPARAKAPRVDGDGVRPPRKALRPAAARLGHGQALKWRGNKQRRLSGRAMFWMPTRAYSLTISAARGPGPCSGVATRAGDRSAAPRSLFESIGRRAAPSWLPRPPCPAGLSLVLLPGRARPPAPPRAPTRFATPPPQRCPPGARPRPKPCTL